jgi:hypothetical protein
MKALTIRQPWAALIVAGFKNIENRTWTTKYRGPLLIHAGGTEWEPLSRFVPEAAIPSLYSRIIGMVDLLDVVESHASPWFEGPYGWVLANPRPIRPVPMAGRLGLFEVNLFRRN